MNKKDLIFKAVIDIIKKEGLHSGITVSNIAENAGIGKGTVYEYFNSKDEVIGESLRYFIKDKMENVIDIKSYDSLSFENSIKKYIDDVLIFFIKDEFIYQIANSNEMEFTFDKKMRKKVLKDLEKAKEKYEVIINYFIGKGIKEKTISSSLSNFNKNAVKNIIMTSIMEFIHISNNIEKDKKEFINNLYSLILKILL